jgi:hypothetical protein
VALPDLPADGVDAAALLAALADGEREGIRAEYKREVGTDDRAKGEWALDVSSFANTAGGILLVGAEESVGRLSALPGLAGDIDLEVQRLDSILRDRVDPGMPGVSIRPVDVGGGTVLAVSIPRSWRAPHLVRSGSRWQVARRTSAGKYVLQDAGEIRAAFAESADVGPRMRRWHDDRVAEVLAGESPVELAQGAFMVVTVQPLGAGVSGVSPFIDIAALRAGDAYRHVRPLYGAGDGPRVNVDGLLASASPGADGKLGGYVQLYRDASLAYVDKKMLSDDRGLPGTAMVEKLVEGIARSAAAVEWAGGTLPVGVCVSLHGVAGQLFHTDRSMRSFEEHSFDRDRVFLPEVVIDRALPSAGEAAAAMRPALDGLWNAVGVESCEYFDDSGAWTLQGR